MRGRHQTRGWNHGATKHTVSPETPPDREAYRTYQILSLPLIRPLLIFVASTESNGLEHMYVSRSSCSRETATDLVR